MSASDPYRFLLRMPPELREPLRTAAARSERSLNAEIVARLEASLDPPLRRKARRPRLVPAIAAAGLLALVSAAIVEQRHSARDDSVQTPAPPLAQPRYENAWAR